MTDLSKITRVTVIAPGGVVFEKYNLYASGCYLSIQDDGRTLKIFPSQQVKPIDGRVRLRFRIKGALNLIGKAVKLALNEDEYRRFVHILDLGIMARKQERSVTSEWLFDGEEKP